MRILLAERDPVTRSVVRRILEAEGHRVTVREPDFEAVRTLRQGAFDLLIAEPAFPEAGLDGSRMPVVMLAGEAETQQATTLNALSKPFRVEDLLTMVSQAQAGQVQQQAV